MRYHPAMQSKPLSRIALTLALLLVGACSSSSNDPAPVVLGTAAALQTTQIIVPLTAGEVETLFTATLINAPVGIPVLSKYANVPSATPVVWTEISDYGLLTAFLTTAVLTQLFGASEVQQNGGPSVDFPLGDSPNGLTIRANLPALLPEDDYHIVHMNTIGIIPAVSGDPTLLYQYAFVFDQDGVSTNNYVTADNDFFNDSDRWYELNYTNANGWRLTVKDATDGAITEIASAARVILKNNAMVLVVPASEFAVPDPAYRVSTFCHTGDFGRTPPAYAWSGDLHPRVAEGLQQIPAGG